MIYYSKTPVASKLLELASDCWKTLKIISYTKNNLHKETKEIEKVSKRAMKPCKYRGPKSSNLDKVSRVNLLINK